MSFVGSDSDTRRETTDREDESSDLSISAPRRVRRRLPFPGELSSMGVAGSYAASMDNRKRCFEVTPAYRRGDACLQFGHI